MLEELAFSFLSGLAKGVVSNVGNEFGTIAVEKCKALLQSGEVESGAFMRMAPNDALSPFRSMAPFQKSNPRVPFAYSLGVQQFKVLASHVPSGWGPDQTEGLCGVDLTGIWCPPGDMVSQTQIRQFGPYFNLFKPTGQSPPLYAEGLLNPETGFLFFSGYHMPGPIAGFEGYLSTDWSIRGYMFRLAPGGGQLVQFPMALVRVA